MVLFSVLLFDFSYLRHLLRVKARRGNLPGHSEADVSQPWSPANKFITRRVILYYVIPAKAGI